MNFYINIVGHDRYGKCVYASVRALQSEKIHKASTKMYEVCVSLAPGEAILIPYD